MAGIYLHIPFCRKKCTYCDFHFSTTFEQYRGEMIDAIRKEIEIRQNYLGGEQLETIYFGGGTPSVLDTNELSAILETVRQSFRVQENAEITLEANPDDITEEKIRDWKNQGVNRLSIGIQSFRDKDLNWMNRSHDVNQALNSVRYAKQGGIENLSIDLIYGLPDMNLEEWKSQIETATGLGVNHISAYCLTIEENTALHHFVRKGKIITADEDRQSDEFQLLVQLLEDKGFLQYEISNFAKDGFFSRHNSSYWRGAKYIGVGPSAHSFNGLQRDWNVAHNRRYINAIIDGNPAIESEILTENDRFNEYLLTGLRTMYGVDIKSLNKIKLPSEIFWTRVNHFISSGDLLKDEQKIVLTTKGRLIADRVASELFIID